MTTYIKNKGIKCKDNSVIRSIKTLNINRNKNAEISSIMYILCNFSLEVRCLDNKIYNISNKLQNPVTSIIIL